MEIAVHRPRPPLDRLVEHITFFSGYCPAHQREVIVPDGVVQIIVDMQERPKRLFDERLGAAGRDFTRAWISGVQSRPIVVEAQQHASLLVIRFHPGGARPVLGFAAEGLNGLVEDFDTVLGRAAAELRDRALAAPTIAARMMAVEDWLADRFCAGPQPPAVVAHLLNRANPYGMRARDLAEELGYSERQLRNIFHAWVGPGPKRYLQIRRFNAVLAHLAGSARQSDAIDWAGLALAFGYADQSHLSADFRRHTGMTPGTFVARHRGETNYLPVYVPAQTPAST